MVFCPKCGKETEHQFCSSCMRELHPLIKKIGIVNIVMCPSCVKIQGKGGWMKKDMQDAVEKQLERAIDFTTGARIDGVLLEGVEAEPGKQVVQLTVMGSADAHGDTYEEYFDVTIMIQGNRCTECEQHANTYFTGIIQLRRPNDIVSSEIERLAGRACTSVKDVTGGIDYYITDHRIVQRVAREIHSMYGGELTIRAQHFSYDSLRSVNLYRVNACIRMPKFWKGDLIRAGTKLMLITSMGKLLKGIDVQTGKTFSAPCKNEYEEFIIHETTLVTTHPSITILSPADYQTVPVANESTVERQKLNPGEKVRVGFADDKWYLLPA